MDNPEKRTTQGIQDKEKQFRNTIQNCFFKSSFLKDLFLISVHLFVSCYKYNGLMWLKVAIRKVWLLINHIKS